MFPKKRKQGFHCYIFIGGQMPIITENGESFIISS
jgi:hypothetical protein